MHSHAGAWERGKPQKENRRISNKEPQNIEGWNRFALTFSKLEVDGTPSFEIGHSLFDIGYSLLCIPTLEHGNEEKIPQSAFRNPNSPESFIGLTVY